MPRLQLFGGPQDGYEKRLTDSNHPDVFYAISPLDEELIRNTSGTKAKAALRAKLAVLAYEYDKTVNKQGVGAEFQYRRAPEQDLSPVVPHSDGEKG